MIHSASKAVCEKEQSGFDAQRMRWLVSTGLGTFISVGLTVLPAWDKCVSGLAGALHEFGGAKWPLAAGLADALGFLLPCALLIATVKYVERRNLKALGVEPLRVPDIAAGLIVLAILPPLRRPLLDVIQSGLFAHFFAHREDVPLASHGYPRFPPPLLVIAADSLFEELGMRAYLTERISEIGGKIWLAGFVSWVTSIAWHVPGLGIAGALERAPVLLAFVILYAWRRNSILSTIVHFLADIEAVPLLNAICRLPVPLFRILSTYYI